MNYKHIFFDLDHTLWDFERNSSESLDEIFTNWSLHQHGITSAQHFIQCFLRINTSLWDAFDRGTLHHAYIRENRFRLVFEELGVPCHDEHLAIGAYYLQSLPTKKNLLEGAMEILNHLTFLGYELHIITNGFDEIQAQKIASAGISHFFRNVVTFETAKAKKPDPRIFQYALKITQAAVSECMMVGDNWIADIMGAKKVGMDTVYLNPAGLKFDDAPTYDIRHLNELREIL
ncbi:Putative HAD-hydrolase YfnB [Dyadobacter sp. CECT 9275]|uniref:HAD-hydrolase YfnB n=1 Tax=Dyadobacter helix TaxID=2822344 RepID=A0A916NDL5_9BACT|nr:YjjG family noncanonical pyrimidine nucleotidase [Dyadobacter sp. CECT 9275]CAG5008999.1 Putative HAD-hydrolase YfnB [Dyadobacter sp. CECT 9275]